MKKIFTLISFVFCAICISAQTTVTWPTLDEAIELGFEPLWGDYSFGYVLPENYTLADNDELTVYLSKASNVSTYNTAEKESVLASLMGSSMVDNSNEPPMSLNALYEGMAQSYAIFQVTPKTSGRLSLTSNRGGNNYTLYVWDTTANNGDGQYIMANTISTNDGSDKVNVSHQDICNVTANHTYWIFVSGTGANVYLWEMSFCPFTAEDYYIGQACDIEVAWPTLDDAIDSGFEPLWGDYSFGYVLPEDYTLADNDDLTVYLSKASNVSTYNTAEKVSVLASLMGSSMADNSNEPPMSLNALYEGMAQSYAIFQVTPKTSGKLSLTSNRGGNNYTLYVWDTTANNGDGQYIMANTISTNDGSDKVNVSHQDICNVTANHTYWIFVSGTGANVYLWEMGFTAFTSENYYTPATTGIENVVTTSAATPTDGKIYSIDGRYVGTNSGNLSKGVYIMNGKKFIVK